MNNAETNQTEIHWSEGELVSDLIGADADAKAEAGRFLIRALSTYRPMAERIAVQYID